MSGNSFGQVFKITTCGESHGGAVAVIVDGCPPGLELSETDIQPELDRRRPGQSSITTPRKEADTIQLLSGVFQGKTTGTPILIQAHNTDQRSQDYELLKDIFRPSHADFTYERKYGLRDWRGSGRASARETLARVAAGAIAKKYLRLHCGVECLSFVEQVGLIACPEISPASITAESIESNDIRCPHADTAKKMIQHIEEVRARGDSVGGIIRGIIRNVPIGLGEPVFDKLHADLGKAMLSINAVKGFEIGTGFSVTDFYGSTHNDPFTSDCSGAVHPTTNRAGGVLGGISTGEEILFRVAFKPVATISKSQETVNKDGQHIQFEAKGRHDPCVLPRAVPIVEAMSCLVLMDHLLRHRAQCLR